MELNLRQPEYLSSLSLSEKMAKKRELFKPDGYIWNALEHQDINTLSEISSDSIIKNIGIMLFYIPNDFYKDTRKNSMSHELAKAKVAKKLEFISTVLDDNSLKSAIMVEKTLESYLCDCVIPSTQIEHLINNDDANLFCEPHEKIIKTILISNRISTEKRNKIFYMLSADEQKCAIDEINWLTETNIDQLSIESEIGKGDLIEEDSNYSDFLICKSSN